MIASISRGALLSISLLAASGLAGRAGSETAAVNPRVLSSVPAAAVSPARLESISRRYLGTPYRLDCLGEGAGPDVDPQFTRKCVDCQTLVEQVMAEALAPYTGGLDSAGRVVRYYGQSVRFENRYHFCIPDWLENPWPARDVTREVAGKQVKEVTRRIDLPKLVSGRGGDVAASPKPARRITEAYIPRAAIADVAGRIPDGSLAIIVSSSPLVVAGHCGLLFRKGETVVLRHASQRKHRVIDQPLLEYVKTGPKSFIGLKVLKPDVAGLRRGASQ
jgi:hypothetical protein